MERPSEWSGHVMTVLGPVARADLGLTLSHEHLIIATRVRWLTSLTWRPRVRRCDARRGSAAGLSSR